MGKNTFATNTNKAFGWDMPNKQTNKGIGYQLAQWL
jgi:hypothetical protein